MTVTLRTASFILRQAQVGDAEPIARYLNDFAVSGNLARVPFPYHLSDAKAWLRTRVPNLPAEEKQRLREGGKSIELLTPPARPTFHDGGSGENPAGNVTVLPAQSPAPTDTPQN